MNDLWRVNFVWLILIVFCGSCGMDSEKRKVKQQNRERFSDQETTRDANFLVNAVDESYIILEIAQLGEARLKPPCQEKARQIVEAQTSVLLRLKTFAEANGMAVQVSGPRKTNGKLEAMKDFESKKFEKEWSDQIKLHYQSLMNDMVNYRKRVDGPLRVALDSVIVTMNENKERILAVNEFQDK